ncbi:hypothetical protein HOC11_02975 [archaeon]|jgi:hypothetical protein|nr:hypothetical protein [archaeon]
MNQSNDEIYEEENEFTKALINTIDEVGSGDGRVLCYTCIFEKTCEYVMNGSIESINCEEHIEEIEEE